MFGISADGRFLARADFDFDDRARKIAVAAAEEAKVVVEAAAVGVKLRMGAEVPFANRAGGVAGGAEGIGQRGFGKWQAVGDGSGIPLGIKFVAKALLVAAR